VLVFNIDSAFADSASATFTRPSPAYKIDGTQVPTDTPRYEAGKFGQAVMIEEGTTNLLLKSQEFNASIWSTGAGAAVAADIAVAPDGTTTADRLTIPANEVYPALRQFWTPANSNAHTLTIWARSATGTDQELDLYVFRLNPWSLAGNVRINVTPSWKRFTLTFSPLDMTQHVIWIGSHDSVSFASDVYLWGAQLENRGYPTTYMKTEESAATRSTEVLTIPTAGVLSETEATIEFIWTPQQPASGINNQVSSPVILQIGNYYHNNSLVLWATNFEGGEGPALSLYLKGATTTGWSRADNILMSETGWYTVGSPIHFAIKWQNADTFYVAVNGVTHGPYTISDPIASWAGGVMCLGNQGASCNGNSNGLYDDLRISSFGVVSF